MERIAGLLWGGAILLAFLGWGSLLGRVLRVRLAANWGLRAAWGLALTVLVGGVLNLAHAISAPLLIGYVLLGVALWATLGWARRREPWQAWRQTLGTLRADPLQAVMVGAVAAGGAFLVLTSAWGTAFNPHDDYRVYLAYSQQMLQVGAVQPNPFDVGRLVTLGGKEFLNALVLCVQPTQTVHLMDPGLGWVIAVAAFAGLLPLAIRPRVRLLLLLLFAAYPFTVWVAYVNVTSVLTTLPLVLALVWLLGAAGGGISPVQRVSLLALTAAAACALKPSNAALCVPFLALWYGWRVAQGPRRAAALAEAAAALTLALVLLSPWLLLQYRSSGTPLYPTLGLGYVGTHSPYPPRDATPQSVGEKLEALGSAYAIPRHLLLALATVLLLGVSARRAQLNPAVPLSLGTLAGIGVIALGTGGFHLHRYTGAFVQGALLWTAVGVVEAWTAAGVPVGGYRVRRGAALLLLAALPLLYLLDPVRTASPWWHWTVSSLRGESDDEATLRAALRRAQATVPPQEAVLACVDRAYLLDFARNRVYAISIPQILPVLHDAETFADYLLTAGIRYALYSYGNEAGFPKARFGDRLAPDTPTWLRQDAVMSFALQDRLTELGETRRVVYDDGERWVIDLGDTTR